MRLIDADALKEKFSFPEESGRMGELFEAIIKAVIDDAPTIEAEPDWIPCSERLPEEKDAGILKKLGKSKGKYDGERISVESNQAETKN